MTENPIVEEMSDDKVLELVRYGQERYEARWNLIGDWRRTRYGEDSIAGLIPDDLAVTNYEHHDSTFDKACYDGASFLSAAAPKWKVFPPKDSHRPKADDVESVLHEIFKPGGVLDTEAGHDVAFTVWENQLENGQGIYKLFLKRNYVLGMPQLRYTDKMPDDGEFEDNPAYQPRSRKDGRDERGESKFRESEASLRQRREAFTTNEFAYQWNTIDPRTYFEIEQDGVPIAAGEINARPASILTDHNLHELQDPEKGFVFLGEATPRGTDAATSGARVRMVNTFEIWTPHWGYFGFISTAANDENPTSAHVQFSNLNTYRWRNALGRLPYFTARGLPSTHEELAMSLQGAFGSVLAETPRLNYLETILYNAAHRSHLPKYQPIPDPAWNRERIPLNTEQNQVVEGDDILEASLPPGWIWEPINPGGDIDSQVMLAQTRERMDNHALAAVLTGQGGDDASGAQISLRINAASRALSPIVRHHAVPLTEMAHALLESAKRLRIPLKVDATGDAGGATNVVRTLELKPDDIITTTVEAILDPALPVDRAALETRGMALTQTGNLSRATAAERYTDVHDWQSERNRINEDYAEPILREFTLGLVMAEFEKLAPEVVREALGMLPDTNAGDLSGEGDTTGGGPGGPFGGASRLLGRGTPALTAGKRDGDAPGGVSARPTVETAAGRA